MVRAAKEAGLEALPGFATPTEAFRALEAGADGLKLFPAEAHPPPVLKALCAVLPPEVPVLPVGGIGPESLAEYWQAGAAGFGPGSGLYQPGAAPAEVAGRAARYLAALSPLRR